MSRSQFAVYQLKKKPELRNLLFRTYEELAQDQIPVQVANYEQVYLGTMKPGETPEQIKKALEQKQPHNYKGHAVSTSDVLILNDNGSNVSDLNLIHHLNEAWAIKSYTGKYHHL